MASPLHVLSSPCRRYSIVALDRGHVVAGLTYTPHVRPTEDEPAPLPPVAGPAPRGRASTAAAAAAASAAAAAAAASHAAGREIGGCLPSHSSY